MAIDVATLNGETKSVASNGKANAGLTTGIIGTTLGVLGLLGAGAAAYRNGNGNGGSVEQDSPVSVFRYFGDRERDNNRMWDMALNQEREICSLRERIAVNETANAYQNQIIANGFANIDERFETERYIDDLILQNALCGVVRGKNMLTMDQIGLELAGDTYGVDTYKRFAHHRHDHHERTDRQPHHQSPPKPHRACSRRAF